MEIWKTIEDSSENYLISSEGNVKKRNGMILKPIKHSNGYLVIGLWNHQKCKQKLLHRLVALAFIPNPNNYSQINHKDGNKSNNRVENLEWVSPKQNQRHRIEILHKDQRGKNNPMYGKSGINSPVFKDYILQLDLSFNVLNRFTTSIEAAAFINGKTKNNKGACRINQVCNHKEYRKTYKGFIWMYEKEYKQRVDLKPCELLETPESL